MYVYGVEESGFNFGGGGGQGACDRVILVLRERIRNTPVDLLVLKAFDDTGSLSSPRRVVSLPGSTLGDCLPFPCGE